MLDALTREEIDARLGSDPGTRAAFLCEAAGQGVAEAQALYGQLLLDGDGVARDQPAAVAMFWRAARQGHVMAINMLGRCHDLGWGVAVDKARAAEWYEVAAAGGLDWAKYNLATLLALGEGIAQDRPRALALLREAVAQTGNAKALNFIGSFHEDGWVVARDMAEAARCYATAAEGGDFRAMFNHARMLLEQGDETLAAHWIGRAAAAANPRFRAKARAWLEEQGRPQLAKLVAIDSHYHSQ